MAQLILAIYVLMAATGFAGLASLFFLRMRTRRGIVGLILVLEAALLGGLAVMIAAFYAGNAGPSRGEGGGTVITPLGFASLILQAVVYATAFLVVGRIRLATRTARALGIAARVLAAANVILPAIYVFLWADALFREAPIPPGFLGGFGYVVTTGAVVALGIALLLADQAGEPPSLALLARGLGICCLAYIPLTVVEALLDSGGSSGLKPISLDFIFYLGLNVVSCMAFARSLSAESGRAYGELSGAAADSLGLTERERAMAEMIARGLANKEIAAELGISPATVRTHIYNLYRKVGARSRVELLNRLAGR
jgi:DNA-binding CsgD family transcriptional regulator